MSQEKFVKLSFTTITLEAPNLVRAKLNTDAEVDLDKAKTFVEEVITLVDNQPFYLLIDSRDIFMNIDHGAREYFAAHKEYNSLTIAKALLVNNMPNSMILKFYKNFYSHQKPIEVFEDIADAKKWLLSHT